MSRERFARSEIRIIASVAILGIVGAAIALRYYPIAFPEASIDFRVSRPEIEKRARAFLEERGFDLHPYRRLTLFRYDDNAKTYLERELGLEQANRLMASEINVWRWKVRFFKPPEKEELIVFLDPAGQLVGFEHIIEEKQPGPRLDKPRAQSVAEIFLHTRLGIDLDEYSLVEDSVQERPNRLDYRFTWERKDFKAKEATYRIAASVYGDQIGSVLPLLKVPEQWQREYRRLRSQNLTLSLAANLLTLPFLIAVIFVLIARIRQRRIHWKPLLWVGGIVGGLFGIAQINSLPLLSETFPTAASYGTFVAGSVLIYSILSIVLMLLLAVLTASGDAVYREVAPDKVALPHLFSLSGLRTKEFFTSTLIGYCLAAFEVGFVVIFYIVARRFGAWSPADVKYSDFLSTTLPWIYPLTTSLFAATSEEFIFRLFAIPFLKKYLKSTWLAVVIPAFVWGFLHSGYPQQPAWIRGVEVGIVGVILGFVMLRFGILATLVSHYTYNAALFSLFLLRSKNAYFLAAGGLVMDAALIPLAIAGALYWQHRRFAAQPELYNDATVAVPEPQVGGRMPTPLPAEEEPTPASSSVGTVYVPLPRKRLVLVVAAGVMGYALWSSLPVAEPLDFLRWQKSPVDAEAVADRFLQERGIDPAMWRRTTNLTRHFESTPAEYVRRQAGIKRMNELWSMRLPLSVASWRVRYFRPLVKEEHVVYVTADGKVGRYDHLVEEKAAGASLAQPEAQHLAADFLLRTYRLDTNGWRLAESKLEKRPARTDYHFIWEEPQPSVGEAYVRAEVDVRGDEVCTYRSFLKVPETWLREVNKPRITQVIAFSGIALLVVWIILFGVRLFPQHTFRWRLYLRLAFLAAAGSLLTQLNQFQTFGYNYATADPLQNYVFQWVGSALAGIVAIGVLAALLGLAADLFYASRNFSGVALPRHAPVPFQYYRDAVLVGISAGLAFLGLGKVYKYYDQLFPVPHQSTTAFFGTSMDTYLPALSVGIDGALSGLYWLALLATVAGLLQICFRSGAWRAIVTALILLFVPMGSSIGVREFIQTWVFYLALAWLFILAVRHFFRANLLAYTLAFISVPLISDLTYYWRQPSLQLRVNALIAPVITAALVLAVTALLQRSLGQTAEPS